MIIHANQRRMLAGMFILCLPHCFDASAARSVGMGGLRQEVGAKSGRPFRLYVGQSVGPSPDLGGPAPEFSCATQVVSQGIEGGDVPMEALLMLQVERDMANARQREIFRQVRQARSDARNAAQAKIYREHLAARRAARAGTDPA